MIAESGAGRIIEVDRDGKIAQGSEAEGRPSRSAPRHAAGAQAGQRQLPGLPRRRRRRPRVRRRDGRSRVGVSTCRCSAASRADGHGPEAFGNKAFAAVRLANGNTLIATGNGHSVLEVTPAKEIVWKLDQNDLPGITLAWVTTLEVLPNGHYVIGNCHAGPENPQLIEVDPKTKKVVWTFHDFEGFGNDLTNSVILDDSAQRRRRRWRPRKDAPWFWAAEELWPAGKAG